MLSLPPLLLFLLLSLRRVSSGAAAAAGAVDLTHPMDPETAMTFPGTTKFVLKITSRGYIGDTGIYLERNDIIQTEHCGTHLDAPVHLAKGKWRVGQIPFERLHGPAVVVDVEKKTKDDPDYQLDVSDLEAWESAYGRIPDGAVVLMRSGHAKHYFNRTRYLGYPPGFAERNPEDMEHLHFPGFHPRAAQWLVDNRSIVGVGVDTVSLDHGPSKDFQTHQILFAQNIWGLENLANLDKLEPNGFTLFAMVQKLREGSGGPARVMALPTAASTASAGCNHISFAVVTFAMAAYMCR